MHWIVIHWILLCFIQWHQFGHNFFSLLLPTLCIVIIGDVVSKIRTHTHSHMQRSHTDGSFSWKLSHIVCCCILFLYKYVRSVRSCVCVCVRVCISACSNAVRVSVCAKSLFSAVKTAATLPGSLPISMDAFNSRAELFRVSQKLQSFTMNTKPRSVRRAHSAKAIRWYKQQW